MNQAQVNAHADGMLDDGTPAEVTAEDGGGDGVGGGVDVEKLRRLRLRGFLRELVRQEGGTEAAELLGVNYKTVARAQKSGKITGRMGDALERLLGAVEDPEVARIRERVEGFEEGLKRLEAEMGVLAKELREGLDGIPAADVGRSRAPSVDEVPDRDRIESEGQVRTSGDGAGRSETRPASPPEEPRPRRRARRRPHPEIVTVDPAEDDVEVYGDAWPLVEEWRRLRVDHSTQGKSLLWLTTEERLLLLELAMLEERGLTLPPEKQPLRGFGRRGQTTHRRKALSDTRSALRRRKLLRWIAPWRWLEKAPELSQGPVSGGG